MIRKSQNPSSEVILRRPKTMMADRPSLETTDTEA